MEKIELNADKNAGKNVAQLQGPGNKQREERRWMRVIKMPLIC